ADAARTLERPARATSDTFLGLPLGVGRTAELGRDLTEEEWERLVVDLRETFRARGTVRSDGSFRQWTNGNLQALLEPVEGGQRLRLSTRKGSSWRYMTVGLAMWGVTAATTVAEILAGAFGHGGASSGPAFLFVVGLGMFGWGAVQLPGWARERREQMEGIIARLQRAIGTGPEASAAAGALEAPGTEAPHAPPGIHASDDATEEPSDAR
ncbi:MAG TPA: hypothetical protein VKA44_04740, partial [Gemmatimonadota bacterium]|nr:hypothetical protein [Gemmatimonadota bacterium]